MKNLPGQIYPVVMTNAAYWQVTVQTREDWVLPTPWVMWCDVTPTSADWWPGLTHKLSVSQHAQQTGRSLLAPPLLLRQLRQLGRPANLRPGQSRSVWATQDSFSAGHSSE